MTWLQFEIVNYDISYLHNSEFIPSFTNKSVKDFNYNDIINVPLLIHKNYELYKIEFKIYNDFLSIYLYVNYNRLLYLIKNHMIIPFRNELFEILKVNLNKFKINKKYFNEIQQYIFNIPQNIPKKCLIYQSLDNNCIEYKKIIFDLKTQTLTLKHKYDKYIYQKLNNYLLIDISDNILEILETKISNNDKTLYLYHTNKDITIIKNKFNDKFLDININNYKHILYNEIDNYQIILLSLKLIKNKKYWNIYSKYHSLDNLEYAYNNIKNNLNNYKKINSFFHNVELIKFDTIVVLNFLNNNYNNRWINFFMQKTEYKKRLFIENSFEINFDYEFYKKVKHYFFHSDISDDLYLNLKFLINNTNFYIHKNKDCKFTKLNLTNINNILPNKYYKYNNLFLFEYILQPKNITYSLSNKTILNKICPITYNSSNNSIFIQTHCDHLFSFNGIMIHLTYSNKCPICSKNIINSNLKFIGSLKLIQQFFIGDINNFNESHIIVDNIIDSKIMNDRIVKIKKYEEKIFIKYLNWEDIIKYKNKYKNKFQNQNWILFENSNQSLFKKRKNISQLCSYLFKNNYKNVQIIITH
jgi:hypothetical protein